MVKDGLKVQKRLGFPFSVRVGVRGEGLLLLVSG